MTEAGPQQALVTLVVMGAVVVFTGARCPPPCGRLVMSIPGQKSVWVRRLETGADRTGEGRVVTCKKCGHPVEVIERAA